VDLDAKRYSIYIVMQLSTTIYLTVWSLKYCTVRAFLIMSTKVNDIKYYCHIVRIIPMYYS